MEPIANGIHTPVFGAEPVTLAEGKGRWREWPDSLVCAARAGKLAEIGKGQ